MSLLPKSSLNTSEASHCHRVEDSFLPNLPQGVEDCQIALGVGGQPDNPDTLYMIPDECIPDDGIIDIEACDDFRCANTPESFRSHLLRFYQ